MASEDATGLLLMWDLRTGRLLDRIRTAPTITLAVTPDVRVPITAI